jgi:hypothetical protein
MTRVVFDVDGRQVVLPRISATTLGEKPHYYGAARTRSTSPASRLTGPIRAGSTGRAPRFGRSKIRRVMEFRFRSTRAAR